MSEVLGIDIGGTGIKAGLVDCNAGQFTSDIKRMATPVQSEPEQLTEVLAKMVNSFDWTGPVGIGYPGVVINGRTFSAAHLSDEWIEADALNLFSQIIPNPLSLINDADAAGLAEMKFGAGREHNCPSGGSVLMLTFGTGIGSALFYNGLLFPNSELGHLLVGEASAEDRAAGKVKTDLGLTWEASAVRLNLVLAEYEKLLSPELIIIGGGLSEKYDQFSSMINCRANVLAAELKNEEGIIGAALHCQS